MQMRNLFALIASAASLVAAQNVVIHKPVPGISATPGESFLVDIELPNSLTPTEEISVAIGLLSCTGRAPPGTCDGLDTRQTFGSLLFAGEYHPVLVPGSEGRSQNYTVVVPEGFKTGPALLSVAHFSLIGASSAPTLEVVKETIWIY